MPIVNLAPALRNWREQLLGLNYQNGAVVSLGLTIVLLVVAGFGTTAAAAAAGLGAMCTSIADTAASPVRHKPVELGVALAGGSLISLLAGLASAHVGTTMLCIAALSFSTALLHGFGRKAVPVSFGLLLPLILTLGTPTPDALSALRHAGLFGLGGLIYVFYAVPTAYLLAYRTRRLALAEALSAFAAYQSARAELFAAGSDTDASLRLVIQRQDVLIDVLQQARELLFRQMRGPRELRLAAALVVLFDIHETVLAIHGNAIALRNRPRGAALDRLIDLVRATATTAERNAATLRRGLPPPADSFSALLSEVAKALDAENAEPAANADTLTHRNNLRAAFDKLGHAAAQMHTMQEMLADDEAARTTLAAINLRAFLLPARYSFAVLRAQFALRSPILRFAIRFTLAMVAGLLVAKVLPYSMHGSWIMLTIAVTMRANYAMSSQRRTDRVLGDLFGCLAAAALLRFAPASVPVVGVICVGLTRVYALTAYRISSMAGCMMGLLLLHYLAPGSGLLIEQRVLDSVIGAGIAWFFSFVLPHWEAHDMPGLVQALNRATRNYADQALRLDGEPNRYRLARKGMIDAISLLSGALRRMLSEPESRRLDVPALERLLGSANLLAAQFASTQVHLRARRDEPGYTTDEITLHLALARQRILSALAGESPAPTATNTSLPVLPESALALFEWLERVEDEARRLTDIVRQALHVTSDD